MTEARAALGADACVTPERRTSRGAFSQKCTHLGCRAPECTSSERFECPCQGSVFNRVGEYVDGPAPRWLDRFPLRIEAGRVVIDTTTILSGLDRTVQAVDGEPAGRVCIPGPAD